MTYNPFDKPGADVYPAHPPRTLRRADRMTMAVEDGAEPLPSSSHMQTHLDVQPSMAQTLAVRAIDA